MGSQRELNWHGVALDALDAPDALDALDALGALGALCKPSPVSPGD